MTRASPIEPTSDEVAVAGRPNASFVPSRTKILVADDDRRNLLAVSEILDDPMLEVVLVESGEDALRQTLLADFALILLDVQMPRMDGYEAATLIRSRPRSSRVPILFLTAFNKDDAHVFQGYSAGAVDYVFKPIQPLILKSKVEIFVDLYRKTEEIKQKAAAEKELLLENLRVRGEKLEAERALRRRDEHQAAVLRGLPIALYTAVPGQFDRSLHFTSDNIERITGFSREAFSQPGLWQSRVNADDLQRVRSELNRASQTGSVTLEYRWRTADGVERHILDQVVLNRDATAEAPEIFGMWFDVTERKELELNVHHASKLEAVGRLTGGIAHDFNNMLSIVIGNLELVQRTLGDNPKAHRRLQSAIMGAQRCAELTSRLLAFSRRSPLQATELDLCVFMPELVKLLQRTLGERISVRLDMAEPLPPVRVDASQLEAALINLAVNARDAMPEGGELVLKVAVVNSGSGSPDDTADRIQITVSDTGTGMEPALLGRVFEPFFTTKEVGKGTGLGLSMVYGFAQQSGGEITIDSTLGQGTTIKLSLPVFTDEDSSTTATAEHDCTDRFSAAGKTILVVEDEADVRQVTTATLQSLGFHIREARSGDDALEMLEADPTATFLFTDVNMPGRVSGIDLGSIVRQRWPQIRVLLTSAYIGEDRDLDGFEILLKPFRASDLAAKLQKMFLTDEEPPGKS
ncbi:response regulator [Methylobacterium sp. NEAU K]|uniref:response regulator n=1 Tax=Methylobacterium sp. NEAU K TaxID=3064946 RepID=UPI002734A70A|nr:response regulator [Methylobacterium sp. NEAU K]MDP4003280.1 response regulator [Methylobacterium sp. NEAU K]